MNIEDSIIILKNIKKLVAIEWKHYITDTELSAIENLLTAYEKEKRLAETNLKDSEEFQDNMCNHRCILNSKVEELEEELEKEKEKNKNKDKILRNIREEFLKYDWKDANPIQTYNQIKSLYESIYCKPYED